MDGAVLLDVGGTFIKRGDGKSFPVDSDGSASEISSDLRSALAADAPYSTVRVAIPGPFDYAGGTFLMRHKFASVYGMNFREVAGIAAGTAVSYVHDVNCMLLGEMTSGGAAYGFGNVALVTIGTGLGFARAENGKILVNNLGSPLESIYDMPFEGGILEDKVSKRGIVNLYRNLSGEEGLTVKEIAARAGDGDALALEAFSRIGGILGSALRPVVLRCGVECLLFGGQISRSFALMEGALKKSLGHCPSLKKISPVSDFDRATFNGLKALLDGFPAFKT